MKGERKGEMKEKEETLGVKNVLLKSGKKNIRRKNRRGKEASTFRYARVEAQKLENRKTKERKWRHVKLAQWKETIRKNY